ncbi:MAG: ABC transporter ATP-binding protein [Bacteroidetes bacterium]|nr:ABC transporter ATP-binding protein [Bacteroidota bacterium]MDA1118975.1 ABC transporter ATP-binding protein [Bacteroidota bacterium]
MANPLLKVENLGLSFIKNSPIFNNINFDIQRGEFVGLAGNSGSGKSALAKTILGFTDPEYLSKDAQITFQSQNKPDGTFNLLNDNEVQVVRGKHISLIFQEAKSALNPVYTCGFQAKEVVIKHLKLAKDDALNLVQSKFKEIGLRNGIYESYPFQLSGGEAQRVMFVMASITSPELIIADEPTTSLDSLNENLLIGELKKLNKEKNIAIILISHDYNLLVNNCHRTLFLKDGMLSENLPKQKPINLEGILPPIISDRTILSVQNITCEIPDEYSLSGRNKTTIIKDISFDLKVGQTLGLVGNSGSGKTTLSRCILQLMPHSGSTIFHNHVLEECSPKKLKAIRQRIQIIFQDPLDSLNPRIKIGKAIMEPLVAHHVGNNNRDRMNIVHQLLEDVHLEENILSRYPYQISGGERQRACIARTLALKPELIICDEPVSSLDAHVRNEILDLLMKLKNDNNLTYIFISHDLGLINFVADSVLVLNEGQVIETG